MTNLKVVNKVKKLIKQGYSKVSHFESGTMPNFTMKRDNIYVKVTSNGHAIRVK